jgi:peptide deformylase
MTVREVLLLGNPKLYEVSEPVSADEIRSLHHVVRDLHDTLMDFRALFGKGRAIAAPQIGVMKRLVYMHINEPIVFVNPALNEKSREMILVWDDCMCFPDLLVKVERHRACSIQYRDMDWQECEMKLEDDLSELLQHEYDHLDGILATSRAIDGHAFALVNQKKYLT